MSGPFVYTPEAAYQPGPYGPAAPTHSPYSPFIPTDIPPYSPYSRPGSIQGSPNIGVSALPQVGVAFPSTEEGFYRQRRPSWHGPAPVINAGGLFPPQGHVRSNSFGHANAPFYPPPATAPIFNVGWNGTYTPWNQQQAALPPEQHIHPWLNGESPRKDFGFNIALPKFSPLRVVNNNGGTAMLGPEELSQFATYPPVYELTITCDRLPQWPIVLRYQPPPPNPYYPSLPSPGLGPGPGGAPPITVGDVLITIHTELHRMVTHSEYHELNTKEENLVKRAYARRCASMGPSAQQYLASQGVKRVDFLGTKCWFKGLIRKGSSLSELTLITGSSA